MSRERNELSMESGMESIQKGSIYIAALLFQIYKKKKKNGTVVPVLLSPVPVPLVQNLAVEIDTDTALTGTSTAERIFGKLRF